MKLIGENLRSTDPDLFRKIKAEIEYLSLAELDERYDDLEKSHGGTYYGTDIAKELFNRSFTSQLINKAVGPLAREYVYDRFRRDLINGRHLDKVAVIFTAGGPGSGKSESVLCGLVNVKDALIFDSTLTKLEHAQAHIEAVLDAEMGVNISYVHRRVEGAMNFAVQRAIGKGMFVEPSRLGSDHFSAQQNILALNDIYKEYIIDGRVLINVFLNLGDRSDFKHFKTGIDFFTNSPDPLDRYADEASAVQRAISADGGRMAQAIASRKNGED